MATEPSVLVIPWLPPLAVTVIRSPDPRYPSEVLCSRCRMLAMPWVEDADRGRDGCALWVCFACDRAIRVEVAVA